MGKVAAATQMMKKKKGRPSLSDLRKRNLEQRQDQQSLSFSHPNFNAPTRRSTSQNPNLNGISLASDWNFSSDDDDDDDRKEKKMKLVVRLPPSIHHYPQSRPSSNSISQGSISNADAENPEINAAGGGSGEHDGADQLLQLEKIQKATDTLNGSNQRMQAHSGPTTTLPDKKLLVFILDRLQKKDTYGVFSEPVNPNELPDYHEVIEHPMDFETVRKKLNDGQYSNLDEFEADVFLISSNAMQYNAPDTIYFRQARSIHELAKRDFENLRQVNDNGEPQPKIVRRGRPPSKNLKNSLGSPPERVGPQSSSCATLATREDNVLGSKSYNMKSVPVPFGFQYNDALFRASRQSHYNETHAEWLSEWNKEFPASVVKASAKHGKKQFLLDDNKRATYKQFPASFFGHGPFALASLNEDMKQLIGVGLHSDHGYAISLMHFAAKLGPVAWEIASKKIESVLPIGLRFGPEWIGDDEASSRLPSASLEWKSSNNSMFKNKNRFNGTSGYGLSSQMGNASFPSKILSSVSRSHTPLPPPASRNNTTEPNFAGSSTSKCI